MFCGIKTTPNGDFCLQCNALVNVQTNDFCGKCGAPLNFNAKNYRSQQEKRIKIELLDELANEIVDEKSLKVILNKLKSI